MIRKSFISIIGITMLILFSSCDGRNASSKEGDYDTTKKMVVDILQTEEGKKALVEIMADEKMRQQLILDSEVVKKTVNDALTSEKGKDMWNKLFKDPDFVKTYSKSMEEGQQKLMTDLLKDAEYQKHLLDLLHNPEVDKQMLQVMKGQKFRSHLEETIQQTLDSPLYQAKIKEILLKAAEKQGQQNEGEQQGGQSGGGQQGSGGGQGESSGGGS